MCLDDENSGFAVIIAAVIAAVIASRAAATRETPRLTSAALMAFEPPTSVETCTPRLKLASPSTCASTSHMARSSASYRRTSVSWRCRATTSTLSGSSTWLTRTKSACDRRMSRSSSTTVSRSDTCTVIVDVVMMVVVVVVVVVVSRKGGSRCAQTRKPANRAWGP